MSGTRFFLKPARPEPDPNGHFRNRSLSGPNRFEMRTSPKKKIVWRNSFILLVLIIENFMLNIEKRCIFDLGTIDSFDLPEQFVENAFGQFSKNYC